MALLDDTGGFVGEGVRAGPLGSVMAASGGVPVRLLGPAMPGLTEHLGHGGVGGLQGKKEVRSGDRPGPLPS
ncbi:hypothetical protein ACFYXM_21945 [Streptomyces sp. NPDC002476]|uniref:hypothetical protein n=1 Tax=Streptomyces sp. NPDC002476 TaxID=3364648 RepID=UPI0036B8BB68